MEIRLCWLLSHVRLFLKGSILSSKFAPCCRPSWRRHVILLCILFLIAGAYLLHTQNVIRYLFYSRDDEFIRDDLSSMKRKSTGRSYGTRNSPLSWDYGDPVLVDFPREDAKTTLEPASFSDIVADKKDMSYGVVVDCGSSGSRVFVYTWPKHSGQPTELLNIQQLTHNGKQVVKKVTPGISTYMNRPFAVKSYLKPLIDYASDNVPKDKHKETPLYVLCTAGMRMLTKRLQGSILEQVQYTIQTTSNFQFYPSHTEVISGMTEGLYFWMGLNYARGRLQQTAHSLSGTQPTSGTLLRPSTVGIIDMGGGSLQIAYEVNKEAKQNFSKQVMEINLGCVEHKSDHEYMVFVDTFLHKGGNAVRSNYESDLVLDFLAKNDTSNIDGIKDPCLPLGFAQEVRHPLRDTADVVVILNGTGNFQLCRRRLLAYLDKSNCEDESKNCIMNGRGMPLINYNREKFFGLSEFFYCTDELLHIGGAYDKDLYESKAQQYCATPWNETWKRFSEGYYGSVYADRVKFQCFKSAWVSVVLHEGFNFPATYPQFTTVKYVNNSEIQWTIGAILYKTRYLPLREIQLQLLHGKNERSGSSWSFLFFPFTLMAHYGSVFLFVCIGIALLIILISLIRFCLHIDQKKVASLRRVGSSVAYFVHEEV